LVTRSHRPVFRARPILRLLLLGLVGLLAIMSAAIYEFTPWPRALHLRYGYDADAQKKLKRDSADVPPRIKAILDLQYAGTGERTRLDVYTPDDGKSERTTVIWIHGGGWLSGDKAHIAPYARSLAGHGFTVVVLNYSLAPESTYPVQIQDVNMALRFVVQNARRLNVNPSLIVLAGDSSGAQLALQMATLVVHLDYAAQLKIEPAIDRHQLAGLLLYCGAYRMPRDINATDETIHWAYSGTRSFLTDAVFATAWVLDLVDGNYPPAFIAVGNQDGLRNQSIELADRLEHNRVRVDRLIYPTDYTTPVEHEFQFDLTQREAKDALERSTRFLHDLK
jgi:acetyl esterase